MNVNELFLDIDKCKHLTELGIDMSNSVFAYHYNEHTNEYDIILNHNDKNDIPTYSLNELLAYIPKSIIYRVYSQFIDTYTDYELKFSFTNDKIAYTNSVGFIQKYEPYHKNETRLLNTYKLFVWGLKNDITKIV